MLNKKCFIFFRREFPDKPCADIAHYIHDIQCANAALRLGHKTVMVYCAEGNRQGSVFSRAFPFQLKKASREFQDFYGADKDLDMAAMPSKNALLLTKYYFPFHIAPRAKLVHTQDFLIAEAAVRCRVPVIYEQHYLEKDNFKKGVVQSPYFRLAVCQSEVTRHNMIERGMPADKAVWMHNGFESEHLTRQPKEVNEWRGRFLSGDEQYLAVYSGALFGFKGIDIIIECAKKMPGIKFVLTGGTERQLSHYRNESEGIKNIIFLGWVTPRGSLISLMQAADILLHPHLLRHGDYTNPVKFFQYLASGTPIAATDLPFLEEFINKDLALAICKPDSVDEFAGCISKALSKYPRKPEGYPENINLSRQFTWEKRMERILERVGLGDGA